MTQHPATPPRRRFNTRERTALYLAADGHCTLCGTELEPGWHADHRDPYTAGGPTDVTNGQALCPTCNLKKGSTVTIEPRGWQRRFIAKYHSTNSADFLCVACPGAGKTLAAGFIARDLLAAGEIDRVLVIVPSGPLRMQWQRALAKLGVVVDGSTMNQPRKEREQVRSAAYGEMDTILGQRVQGWVVTYQSMAAAPELHRRLNSRKRTLVILDEVHHLSERGSWGGAAITALGVCVRRLALSGTPFRGDGKKIPFVEYDEDGWCRYADRTNPDGTLGIYPRGFDYSYGTALSEHPAPVRPSVFEMFDGDVAWMEFGKDDPQEARISDPTLDPQRRRKTNRQALNAAGEWLRDVLVNADKRLSMVREEGDTQAQGLVVCRETEHAHQVAEVLRACAGPGQVHVAVSRDHTGEDSTEEARKTIETFGAQNARWLVAVQMVSEGVDIPQLRVGVYATTVRSPLFFRQVLGRFVRRRSDLPEEVDQTAYLFVAKDPDMIELADQVQGEVRTAILREDASDPSSGSKSGDDWQPTLELDSFLRSTSEAGGILLPGRGSVDHALVEKIATDSGKPASVIADVLASMQRLGVAVGEEYPKAVTLQVAAPDAPSYPDQIKSKKNLLERNLRQIAGFLLRKNGGDFQETIKRLKAQVYRSAQIDDYRRADLPDIERALVVARVLLEKL